MKVSVSNTGQGKVYTYGFKFQDVTLDELVSTANRCAVSGAEYEGGHRKASNVVSGSNLILIDCDEPGQAEAVEARLSMYDYVKVPSASNLSNDCKWHYFIPTQVPLSNTPGGYKYQVQQFFNQVGITDEMIDVTGSYDIARQFAPAMFDGADELSVVNDTELRVPVMEVPEELNNEAYESITVDIGGIVADELPSGSVWYQGKAITYADTVKALSSAGEGVIVSGFGCPHNNKHSFDNKRGYGFAYKSDSGEIVIKCSGNACKDEPYFVVPFVKDDVESEEEVYYTSPVNPELYRSAMESHWLNNLGQVKADGMNYNWFVFASTMNAAIGRNIDDESSVAHIIPMATGESKTQGSIVYLSMLPSDVKAMMVVKLNADAFQVAEQINELGGDAVAYNSSADVDIEDASGYQTAVVSHEFFKRNGYKNNEKWKTLADDRELFIIDEALHSIDSATVDKRELEVLSDTVSGLNAKGAVTIIDAFFGLITGVAGDYTGFEPVSFLEQNVPMDKALVKQVYGTDETVMRYEITNYNREFLQELIDELKGLSLDVAVSCRSRRIDQKHLESYYRVKDIEVLEGMKLILGTGAFLSKKRNSITGVRELVPGGVSFVVLDATAPVNAIYDLQREFKGDVKVVNVKRTRNYDGFTIKQARTLTGKSSLDKGSVAELCNSIGQELVDGDKILFVTHKVNKVFIEDWKDNTSLDGIEVAIEHYGNITGKNDWRDYNKVALIGLPHKGTEFYQSLNIVKTCEATAYGAVGKTNHTAIEYTDLASDMVQAMARIRVRNIVDSNGGCLPAIAYVTLNSRDGLYGTLQGALKSQFRGADIEEWNIESIIKREAKTPTGYDPTLAYLQDRLTAIGADIGVYEPRDVLDIERKTYSRLLKNERFLLQLEHLGLEIQSRKVVDKRGRTKKRPSMFFVRVQHLSRDWDEL